MNPSIQLPRRPWVRALLLLTVCWALAFLGPLSYLVVPAVLVALWRALRQRAWVAYALLLVLNPVSGFFGGGVAAYLNGAPALRSCGAPTLEAFNPDPASRCFRSAGTCLIAGHEWLTMHLPNTAVRLMCRCCGPPALAYDGPYPTKQEALELMDDALQTPVDHFLKGRALADGAMVRLPPAVVAGLAGLVGLKDDLSTPVRARLYQEKCVVLRLSRRASPADLAAGFDTDVLVLVDKSTQRPFAYYKIKGDTLPQVPPVTYLE